MCIKRIRKKIDLFVDKFVGTEDFVPKTLKELKLLQERKASLNFFIVFFNQSY